MGLGTWTTVEGVVYPSSGRYGGGFQWMVVDDENRKTNNQSKLKLRPYIEKKRRVSSNDTYNEADQTSYFEVDGDKKKIKTAFMFSKASVGVIYPLASDYPFKAAGDEYVEYIIQHDSSGSATVKIVGYIKGEASSNHFQYVRTTQTVTLPQISRASTVTVQETVAIGESATLYISKTNDAYTNTIQYSINGYEGDIAVKTTASSVEWAVGSLLGNAVPEDSVNAKCTITCITYDGDKEIGRTTTSTLLYIAEEPTFEVRITTDASDNQLLISGISTVTVEVINAKATTGAANSVNFSITDGEVRRSTNPAVFPKATKDVYTVTVTDSRGISASKSVKLENVSPYVPPTIGSVDIERDIEKGNAEVSVRGKWTSGVIDGENKNEFMIVHLEMYEQGSADTSQDVRYEIDSDSPDSPATVKEFSVKIPVEGLALDKAYTLLIYAIDIYYNIDDPESPIDFPAVPFRAIIPRAVPVFQWTEDTFRINGNLEVTGTYPGGGGGASYTEGTGIDISSDGVISVETIADAVQNDERPVSSGALYLMFKQIDDAIGGI